MFVLHLFVFTFLIMMPIHEIGHYLAARKEGIYKGWGIFPNPHIKLTEPHGSRWGYLSGFLATLLLYPYWAWMNLGSWIMFLMICGAAASQDIFIIVIYDRMKKRRRNKRSALSLPMIL